jgi:hypothetical protein
VAKKIYAYFTSITKANQMAGNAAAFIQLIKHPLKFRMFLFYKLPSAYFAGVRIKSVTTESCEVTVPYKWFSQNPFRSTYFACLSMAAEMSTGALAMAHTYKSQPAISMLVTRVEGDFIKKATGITTFLCEEGNKINELIAEAVSTGEARTVKAKSTGRNKAGEVVAEFFITWSFKSRSGKN